MLQNAEHNDLGPEQGQAPVPWPTADQTHILQKWEVTKCNTVEVIGRVTAK